MRAAGGPHARDTVLGVRVSGYLGLAALGAVAAVLSQVWYLARTVREWREERRRLTE